MRRTVQEVLEQFVFILGHDHLPCRLDDRLEIFNESLAIGAQLILVNWRVRQDMLKGLVDLGVGSCS